MSTKEQTIDNFLNTLAEENPAPGGGAVAGILVGLSSSLAEMVASYSSINEKMITALPRLREEALALCDADAKAYLRVSELWKLPKDNPLRMSELDSALAAATKIPLQTMAICKDVLIAMDSIAAELNPMLASDLAIAATVINSAAKAGYLTANANIKYIENKKQAIELQNNANALLDYCIEHTASIEKMCKV